LTTNGTYKVQTANIVCQTKSELIHVKRNNVPRFEVLPKRWIVERTLAWISHCRRLARDFERHARTVVAFVYLAMIRLMLRRLTATRSA
jgi:putative transposase